MGYCIKCGNKITEGAAFCTKCGAQVITRSSQPEVVAEPEVSVAPEPYQQQDNYYSQPESSYSQPEVYNSQPAQAELRPINQVYQAPLAVLPTNRSLGKFFWLSMITFGIYGLVIMTGISTDINLIARRYDGKKTMNYCLVAFIFSWLTLGIVPLVWYSKLSSRIGTELQRRGIDYPFGAKDFWLWNVLGSCIVCGPFIYCHKLMKSMNLLCGNYNISAC